MASMTLTRVEPGQYLTPADRMARIRTTRAVLAEPPPTPEWEWNPLGFWTAHGALGIAGLDEVPEWNRRDREGARRYIAREDWKARVKRKRKVSARFRRIVIERARSRCEYCGRHLAVKEVEIDHVVPVARGGGGSLGNLACSCHDCNASKFDYLIEEWLDDHHTRMREAAWKFVRETFPDYWASLAT